MGTLLGVAALCTCIVLMTACLVLAALGHDRAGRVAAALGIILPTLMLLSAFS